jgi:hypothetical protein
MGQHCCALDDNDKKNSGISKNLINLDFSESDGSVLDYDEIDQILNRWVSSDVIYLQVIAKNSSFVTLRLNLLYFVRIIIINVDQKCHLKTL